MRKNIFLSNKFSKQKFDFPFSTHIMHLLIPKRIVILNSFQDLPFYY